jgi:uncharacterized membrane protein YkoI
MATMQRTLFTAGLVVGLAAASGAQTVPEKSTTMSKLPTPVQQAIKSYVADNQATLRGLSSETEDGRKLYEAELRVNGKNRDVTFDQGGQVVLVEQEVALADVPAPARAAITKAAGKARITMVESLTENGKQFYEAHLAGGKTKEVKVDASGAVAP